MIADVGGLLGLFLGCSVLSLVEIIHFIFAVIINIFRKSNVVASTPQSDENSELRQAFSQLQEEMKNFSEEVRAAHEKFEQDNQEVSQKLDNLEANAIVINDF